MAYNDIIGTALTIANIPDTAVLEAKPVNDVIGNAIITADIPNPDLELATCHLIVGNVYVRGDVPETAELKLAECHLIAGDAIVTADITDPGLELAKCHLISGDVIITADIPDPTLESPYFNSVMGSATITSITSTPGFSYTVTYPWIDIPQDFYLQQPGGMKHTVLVGSITGFNTSPLSGAFLVDRGRMFTTRNVEVGCSISNMTKKKNGVVVAVTDDELVVEDMIFDPGDFYTVWLQTPLTLANTDGPIIEIDCRRCGFSYPRKDLIYGLCVTCRDKDRKTKR